MNMQVTTEKKIVIKIKCINCQNKICEECEKLRNAREIKKKSDHCSIIAACLIFEIFAIILIKLASKFGVH